MSLRDFAHAFLGGGAKQLDEKSLVRYFGVCRN